MTISIDPALIANAQPVPPLGQAIPINLCKPPKEGLKVVNFQVSPLGAPINTTALLVDMAAGNPNPPLSQVGSIFIDAINSGSDVSVLFADTGYRVRIAAGNSALIPAITGISWPKFYVIFDVANAQTSDIANIFVLNQFVPEFVSDNFIKAIDYGIVPTTGASLEFGPSIAQTRSICSVDVDLTGATTPNLAENLYAGTAILSGMQLILDVKSSSTSRFNVLIIGQQNLPPAQRTIYFSFPVIIGTTEQIINLCSLTDLKMETLDNNSINVYIDNNTNLDVCLLTASLQGDGLF